MFTPRPQTDIQFIENVRNFTLPTGLSPSVHALPIIFNKKGEPLTLLNYAFRGGIKATVGGKIEKGEAIIDTVLREADEELGPVAKVLGITEKNIKEYASQYSTATHTFLCLPVIVDNKVFSDDELNTILKELNATDKAAKDLLDLAQDEQSKKPKLKDDLLAFSNKLNEMVVGARNNNSVLPLDYLEDCQKALDVLHIARERKDEDNIKEAEKILIENIHVKTEFLGHQFVNISDLKAGCKPAIERHTKTKEIEEQREIKLKNIAAEHEQKRNAADAQTDEQKKALEDALKAEQKKITDDAQKEIDKLHRYVLEIASDIPEIDGKKHELFGPGAKTIAPLLFSTRFDKYLHQARVKVSHLEEKSSLATTQIPEQKRESNALSFALVPTTFNVNETQERFFSQCYTFPSEDGSTTYSWGAARHALTSRDIFLSTQLYIIRPNAGIYEIKDNITNEIETICGSMAYINPAFAGLPINVYYPLDGYTMFAFKYDAMTDEICPWDRAGLVDDYIVAHGVGLHGFDSIFNLDDANDLDLFYEYVKVIKESRQSDRLSANLFSDYDRDNIVNAVRKRMHKLFNWPQAETEADKKRLNDYGKFIQDSLRKFGAGKGYGADRPKEEYINRLVNKTKRERLIYPDFNHKQLIIEFLQQSLSGEIANLFEDDKTTVNVDKLKAYIDSLGKSPFGIRASTLAFSFGMDDNLESIYRKEGRIVKNKFDHDVVMYKPLPAKMVKLLKLKVDNFFSPIVTESKEEKTTEKTKSKHKAKGFKTLNDICEDTAKKSKKKSQQTQTLSREKFYGFHFCNPDMRTGGVAMHYAVEHNGMTQNLLNDTLKTKTDAEKAVLVEKQTTEKKNKFIKRNANNGRHIAAALLSVANGEIPMAAVEYAGSTQIQDLFHKHNITIAQGNKKTVADMKAVVDDLRESAFARVTIPQGSSYGYKGLTPWSENGVYIDPIVKTIAVESSASPHDKNIASIINNFVTQMLAHKPDHISIELEGREKLAMAEIVDHLAISLGLHRYGLRCRNAFHNKNQLDYSQITAVLRELEYRGLVTLPENIHLQKKDDRVKLLAEIIREFNLKNPSQSIVNDTAVKFHSEEKDDNVFIKPILDFYYAAIKKSAENNSTTIDEKSILSPALQWFNLIMKPFLHDNTVGIRDIRETSTGNTYYQGDYTCLGSENLPPKKDNPNEDFVRYTVETTLCDLQNKLVQRCASLNILMSPSDAEFESRRSNEYNYSSAFFNNNKARTISAKEVSIPQKKEITEIKPQFI